MTFTLSGRSAALLRVTRGQPCTLTRPHAGAARPYTAIGNSPQTPLRYLGALSGLLYAAGCLAGVCVVAVVAAAAAPPAMASVHVLSRC